MHETGRRKMSGISTSVTTRGTETRPFKKWVSWIVPMFVVANVVLFVITMYVNDCPKYSFSCFPKFLGRFSFQPLKENPLLGPSSATLQKMGALEINMVVHQHQAWRLFTSMWLHAGVIHILANMLSLVFIGLRLEQEFGFVKIGLLYIISGFGASILSALFLQSTISVGASGALFGLLGAMLSELLTNWTIYANKIAALLTLVLIIIINLAVGILPHVDNFAHIGGFITGFLLGFVLLIRPQFGWVSRKHSLPGTGSQSVKPKHKPYQYLLWIVAALLLTAGTTTCLTLLLLYMSAIITVGLLLVLRGASGNQYCSWCHYLTCFPTSKWSCKPQQVFCESTEMGSKLNLTCINNGKSQLYPVIDDDSYRVQQLCSQLCT